MAAKLNVGFKLNSCQNYYTSMAARHHVGFAIILY